MIELKYNRYFTSEIINMSQDEDLALFKAMMGDVQPLQNDTAQHTKKHQTTSAQLARRKAAVCLHEDSIDALSLDHAPEQTQ